MNKQGIYQELRNTLDLILKNEGEKYSLDLIGIMSLIVWAIKHYFPHLTFVGFYRVTKHDQLTIGPYQGDVIACGTIPFGKGVCGVAAKEGETVIVPDVSKFPGYIACDNQTRSEIVVPVIINGKVTAVLDLDSPESGAFDEVDRECIEDFITSIFHQKD